MDKTNFAQRLNKFQRNVNEIYRRADQLEQSPSSHLRAAYKELGTASEELQVAMEELVVQAEELTTLQLQLKAEHQQYKDLFEFLPSAYLITDAQGHILQANQAAAALFNRELRFLVNKPLTAFLTEQERQSFPSKLSQLHQCQQTQQWSLCLQLCDRAPYNTSVTVVPVHDAQGKLTSLRWSLQNSTDDEQVRKHHHFEPNQNRWYCYNQGEIVPLEPASIWLVCQGLVKLTTVSEDGAEVLVGIAGPTMPFSSNMTSLPTYQATALSEEVQLVSIPLAEITSPQLRELLLPQILLRLRQTEILLAIAGKRHIQDRLHYLLLWLKQNYSQPTAQGTCLSIRLTHQELADACCTTRVSIARELSKLKKQGKIIYDPKYHIVFVEG